MPGTSVPVYGSVPVLVDVALCEDAEVCVAVDCAGGAVLRLGWLLCAPTVSYLGRRDITFVPVTGLPDSSLALVWHKDAETTRTRALAAALRT